MYMTFHQDIHPQEEDTTLLPVVFLNEKIQKYIKEAVKEHNLLPYDDGHHSVVVTSNGFYMFIHVEDVNKKWHRIDVSID